MKKRAKTVCPIKSCGEARYNLPRHVRLIHHWPDEEAKNVKNLYGLRKKYCFKTKTESYKCVQSRPSKACPVFGYRLVTKNMS